METLKMIQTKFTLEHISFNPLDSQDPNTNYSDDTGLSFFLMKKTSLEIKLMK